MKAFIKHPRQKWMAVEIENTLEALQTAVGGYIECVTLAEDMCLVVDEEGLLKGKEYNINFCGLPIVGTALLVGVDGENFCDVPDDIKDYLGGI